GFTSDSIS
ncbi:hypothetical protein SCA6_006742, partial [Theobroma cacao]